MFSKDGKELHLEIAHRLMTLGYRIGEVPAVLSWPERADARKSRGGRTTWKTIQRLIVSHLAYGFLQGISKIVAPAIVLLTLAIAGFAAWAVWNFLTGGPSIFLVMLTGVLLILWTTLMVGYFLLVHVSQVETDLWRVQHVLARHDDANDADRRRYYDEEPLPP
jgi:ABC-type glycerol-3-phosphate transport system permease component